MAEITLLHQEIIMLKLRITALEAQRNDLESDLAVANAERDQADEANTKISDKLKNSEKVCAALQLEILRERNTSQTAIEKIVELETEIQNLYGSDSD